MLIQPENYCVDDPEITEVCDMDSGEMLSARDAIGADYDRLIHLRMELAESNAANEEKYSCPICGVGVYLVCSRRGADKRFFFRHRAEDGNCPAVTRGSMSKEEIEARKYNGAKESRAHQRMKEILAESIGRDSRFSDLQVEKVWRGMDRTQWRKPDVSAVWDNSFRVAFEVQLSTTFLHVIAQRRIFYRKEGGLLCWVFKNFNAEASSLTQDDIFHNNNRNLFLASEETLKTSKDRGALVLDCRWAEPTAGHNGIEWTWRGELTAFSELTLDLAGQRVFHSDREQLDALAIQEAEAVDLKMRFARWWAAGSFDENEWKAFQKEFAARRILLPKWQREASGLLNALYTAKEGHVIGWEHSKFISAAHTIAGSHKKVVRAFRAALQAYGRAEQIKAEDPEGRWAKKVAEYKPRINARDKEYERDKRFDSLIAFLFPEAWRILSKEDEN